MGLVRAFPERSCAARIARIGSPRPAAERANSEGAPGRATREQQHLTRREHGRWQKKRLPRSPPRWCSRQPAAGTPGLPGARRWRSRRAAPQPGASAARCWRRRPSRRLSAPGVGTYPRRTTSAGMPPGTMGKVTEGLAMAFLATTGMVVGAIRTILAGIRPTSIGRRLATRWEGWMAGDTRCAVLASRGGIALGITIGTYAPRDSTPEGDGVGAGRARRGATPGRATPRARLAPREHTLRRGPAPARRAPRGGTRREARPTSA